MHAFSYLKEFALLVGLTLSSGGCLMAGNYHSAKTLGKGESAVGLNFSATTYEYTDADGGGSAKVTIPSLIPELTYHVGMSDDVEIGGRVGLAQLAIEGDLKYRFFHDDNLHLALAPAIGAQTLVLISGGFVRLPVIGTYEITDNVAITGSLFASTTSYSTPDVGSDSDDEELARFSGSLVSTGGSLGFEFSGETFAIRPAVEFGRYVGSFEDETFEPFNTTSVVIHLAFIGGREKKQLDRIENKLDRMNGTR